MNTLACGLGWFAVAFVAHVLRWRIARPAASGQALIRLMVATILLAAATTWFAGRVVPGAAALVPANAGEALRALVLALALAASWVMTYPAVEVESPTLVMVKAIADRGAGGLAEAELRQVLDEDVMVSPRIRDLLDERLAALRGDRLVLTAKGAALARAFAGWRSVLRLGMGG